MFKRFIPAVAALALVSCAGSDMNMDVNALADAEEAQVSRVEPLSWWTGMKTPLQLMVYGEGISDYTVSVVGPAAEDGTAELSKAVKVTGIHKADSPNYLFADVKVDASAAPGTYYLVFSDGDAPVFKYPYEIQARREGSAARKSFTTADLMYLIMPDRFANGDPSNDSTDDTADKLDRKALFGRHGGDLQGIINHLDYIADLGVTAIWCTPLLEDNQPEHSYHGYACTDYYHIDSRFGCNCLYKEYVAKAHEKGIKIVMDIVTNHCGSAHWWIKDLPFKDWIHQFPEYTGSNVCFSTCMDTNASAKDLNIHESGWFDTSMPDMNLDNPYVLQYFKQWAVWWIEYADLDGLRVDTYPYNEKEPMSEWCKSVRNEYPDINIVGECWTSSIPQLAYWQGDNENKDGFNSNLPSIMDFPLYDAICAGVPRDSLGWGQGMTKIYDCVSHDFVYHDISKMLIFPGNHDTDRIADVVRGNVDRVKLVMTMMATMRGIPQIFAGDELMFRSCDLSMGHGGLRVDFPGGWPGDTQDFFTAEGRKAAKVGTDGKALKEGLVAELYDYHAALFNWRKGKKVIHDGKTMHFLSRDNTYAYFRYDDTDAVFVYVNNSRGKKHIPWSYYSEITAGLADGRNVITGEPFEVSDETVVGPRQVLVVEYSRNR